MYRILAAVDGSETSAHVLEHIGRLKQAKLDVEIRLIHVQELPVYPVEYMPAQAIDALMTAGEYAQSKVLGVALARITALGFKASTCKAKGLPADEIVREATAWNADQIVMGSRGLGSMKSLVLGSISRKVLHWAKMPVTLVK